MAGFRPRTRTGQFLSLAREYWSPAAPVLAWAMLAFVVVAEIGQSWITAWYTEVQKDFFDAMTARDAAAFRTA